MKKNIIWLLTIVMSITFVSLLYFQIMYLEKMVKMRKEQFSETVMRCLSSTSSMLERNEALYFLQQDISIMESSLYSTSSVPTYQLNNEWNRGLKDNFNLGSSGNNINFSTPINYLPKNDNALEHYKNLQTTLRNQYLYQRELLNEIVLSILRDSGKRPAEERADSTIIRSYLSTQLEESGLELPFEFAISTPNNRIIYATKDFNVDKISKAYSQLLFSYTDTPLKLLVEFPTSKDYIFSSVRFVFPTLVFSLILLVVFLFTIILAFRQKKLTEMKTDFINNMTHELKTPISTISLAAQMLNDDSVTKSPTSLKHLSNVILDESKRLRFQVEKVLQMSVFENSNSSLKYVEVDANTIIQNVINTFKIKVEKYGGDITFHLNAEDAIIKVDEMHFTNIIYNLLDNAIKYRNPDIAPVLDITTTDISDNRLQIRIKDNGIGIKKEDIKKIFDKFYRVHTGNLHDVKGFGLGLTYVKKMITLFHGSINVESEIDKGSTFIITLPLEM